MASFTPVLSARSWWSVYRGDRRSTSARRIDSQPGTPRTVPIGAGSPVLN
ncbi:hypothetical protein HMPREF9005_2221 [Actinomyces sp. oral taxon 178 str. F0338]|nr:hypothetical protein HMPREF9005_2221 [Actinomyces sp. oral taxon 178 str. F0338]